VKSQQHHTSFDTQQSTQTTTVTNNGLNYFIKKLDSAYATKLSGKKRRGWRGSISFFLSFFFFFLEKWENPIDDPENLLERITTQGIKD